MRRDDRGKSSRSTDLLTKLDYAAHGVAFVSCLAGGIGLESIILLAAASHHLASIGFQLRINENGGAPTRSRSDDALFSVMQLILWTCCLLLTTYVIALGAHGVFHADPLEVVEMARFAAPGGVAAITTFALVSWAVRANAASGKTDAFLSAVPTVLSLCFAFSKLGANAGRLDALAGLGLVIMLCARTLVHLGQALD